MRNQTSDQGIHRKGFGAISAAALVAALVLIAAGPARARNEFENAFEDQLGRIAAYGAVDLGLRILSGGYYPPVPLVPVPVAYYGYDQGDYYGYGYQPVNYYGDYGHDHYYGPRRVVVKYPKHYRHDRGRHWNHYRSPRHGDHGSYYGHRRGGHDDHRYGYDRGHGSRGNHHRDGRGRGGHGGSGHDGSGHDRDGQGWGGGHDRGGRGRNW